MASLIKKPIETWTEMGGEHSSLGTQVVAPQWAAQFEPSAATSSPSEFKTTGGHGGTVAFFKNGLIYWRNGLAASIVMLYEEADMGGDTSARFRLLLLDHFTDVNGLVLVNYDLSKYKDLDSYTAYKQSHPEEVGDESHPIPGVPIADNTGIDTNDAAWMTGQALAAVSFLGDMVSAGLILEGMLNHAWSPTGNLLRYTGNEKKFAGPDPTTQFAGCYFAAQAAKAVGNDEVAGLARSVVVKWVDMLFRCNGKIGPSGPILLIPHLISLYQIAKAIDVEQSGLDKLTHLINEQKLAVAILTWGTLSAVAILDDASLFALCTAVSVGLQVTSLSIPEWLNIKLDKAGIDLESPNSGVNLAFWQLLTMHECIPTALQNRVTEQLAATTKSYDMMPLQWLGGGQNGVDDCKPFVQDWGAAFGDTDTNRPSLGNYLWRTDNRDDPGSETFNKVDYLTLRGLFSLDRAKWENAPHHIGVSCNVPVPNLGAFEIAGSVESDGTFSLTGTTSITPFGHQIHETSFTFNNDGMTLSGELKLPGCAAITLFGEIKKDASFLLAGTLWTELNIGNCFVVADASGSGAATIRLSSSVPHLEIVASISLLGLKRSLNTEIKGSGFAFDLTGTLSVASYNLACAADLAGAGMVRAVGKCSFQIDQVVGPVQVAPGMPSLGRISINAGVTSTLEIEASDTSFGAKSTAAFVFQGITCSVPPIMIDVVPDSLDAVPAAIIKYVVEHPAEILGELFDDVNKWLNAVRDKIITEVQNVADVLSRQFRKDSEFIANAIQNTLGHGVDAAADGLRRIGETADKVASILKSLNGGTVSHAIVRAALEFAKYSVAEVSDAMQHAFGEVPHQDSPAIPAVDTYLIPHLDTAAGPHVDAWAIPHVDTASGPHVDTWLIPHVDQQGPHIDTPHSDGHPFHADHGSGPFHVDASGPHVDTAHQDGPVPPHVDTPHQNHQDGPIPPHVDTPHQNHGDGPVPPHADTPAQQHVDTPAQGHIDVP
jgi:hypothetical protein